jgi:TonB family protein
MKKKLYRATMLIVIASAVATFAMTQQVSSNEMPLVITAVAPAYPVLAVASNTSGTVEVEVQINASGEVASARSINGHPLLCKQAEITARRWRFELAKNNTETRIATLKFVFRIAPKETSADDLTSVFTPPYQVEVKHKPFEPIIESDPPSFVRPTKPQKKKGA